MDTIDASPFLMPVADSSRARRYLAIFDDAVARAYERFDTRTGLIRHRVPEGSPGAPSEIAELDRFERKRYISPLNTWAYSVGRHSANTISALALAWAQPLSRHHRAPDLFDAVCNGLDAYHRVQVPSGEFVFSPLRFATIYGSHEMAWRVEGLLTAWLAVHDALDDERRRRYEDMLVRAMRFLRMTPCDHPCNRGVVWCAVMAMCGRATGDGGYYIDAARIWELVTPHVFAQNGEIREGAGPCSNYSALSYEYLVRYRLMTDDRMLDPIILRSTDWMIEMYTDRMVPFLGVSTRRELVDGGGKMLRALPGMELFMDVRPHYAAVSETVLDRAGVEFSGDVLKNGGISWITAAWLHDREAYERAKAIDAPRSSWVHYYQNQATEYATVGQDGYQTMVTIRSIPAKKGLQTWAANGEPPFIAPDDTRASTVRAWGFDLAARDTTPWDLLRADTSELSSVTARHGDLTATYLFGAQSTIVVHTFHGEGPRETIWRGSARHIAGYEICGERVVARGAGGSLHWLGAAPEIGEEGFAIRFADDEPTRVFAFAAGTFRWDDLPGSCATAGEPIVCVAWTDGAGRYVAAINQGNAAAPVRIAEEDGEPVVLAPGEAHVRLVGSR